jgi:predicted permease
MDPDAAAREARRMFGNVLVLREETRAMWGFPRLDTLLQDIRFGLRLMRRSPSFTVVAILSLAIGIGASVAVFGLADAVLFRKLPVRDPESLLILRWTGGHTLPFASLNGYATQNETESSSTSFSLATFDAFREQGRPAADVVGFADLYRVNLAIDGSAELGTGQAVSGNYFDVLGVPPALGRSIAEPDDARNAAPVVMLSYAFWRRRFGGDANVLGRTLAINGIPFTIVGVAPRGFQGTLQVSNSPSLFVPLRVVARLERTEDHFDPNYWWVLMMARVRDPASLPALSSSFDATLKQQVVANKPALTGSDVPRLSVDPGARGQTEDREGLRQPLVIMAAVVAIVLLVACANIANLLLARAAGRRREIAMRLAIGAQRSRIVRQLLVENFLLATTGAAGGLILAHWLSAAMLPALELSDSSEIAASLDWRAAAFTALVAVAASLMSGLLPALRAARRDVLPGIQEAVRGQIGATRRFGLAGVLVAVQVALSIMLVAAAGLLVGSVRNLERVNPGFDPTNILLFRIDPTLNGYNGERLRGLQMAVLERVRAVPGVTAATMSDHTLISNSSSISEVYRNNVPQNVKDARRPLAWRLMIDDEFFHTMRIPLVSGRTFGRGESPQSQPVAIVNATFARNVLNTDWPIGERFKMSKRPNAPEYEVVGVAADARYTRLRGDIQPTVYLSARQNPSPGPATFEVKTAGDPLAVVESIRHAVTEIDANVPLFDVRTQAAQIRQSMQRERLFARLATTLGIVVLTLSAIGIYGLLVSIVARRVPEIGVRVALGASRRDVVWMVLRHSLILVGGGVALGVPAALMSMGILESLLFGVAGGDPHVLFLASAMLVAVAALAAWLPARRASRIDPVIALRV